jgi:hypothetical protein
LRLGLILDQLAVDELIEPRFTHARVEVAEVLVESDLSAVDPGERPLGQVRG